MIKSVQCERLQGNCVKLTLEFAAGHVYEMVVTHDDIERLAFNFAVMSSDLKESYTCLE